MNIVGFVSNDEDEIPTPRLATTKPRVLVLGAGFAGMELATALSDSHGDRVSVTVLDRADSFVFGYSKLDVMFGKATVEEVRLPYGDFVKPGVSLRREAVRSIDPAARRVVTDAGTHDADILVIALGADYDVSKNPGVTLGVNEFYSVEGATHLRSVLPGFRMGHAVVGVCGAPYKCPPAPSECALMLHDYLLERGVRGDCTITIANPMSSPVPPSPETAQALLAAFAERGIEFLANSRVTAFDEQRKLVLLDGGRELPCDLFLGVPRNRAPDVVVAAGMTEDGWVTIDPRTLETEFPRVRGRRPRQHRRSQGRHLCRSCSPRHRQEHRRAHRPRRAHRQEPRRRLLLHRVRRRPHRPRRRRLLLRTETDRHVQRAERSAARGQEEFRRHAQGALVRQGRRLTSSIGSRSGRCRGSSYPWAS